jgi:hypothetical protein
MTRRAFQWVQPHRPSLKPEAAGTAKEVTNWLKHSEGVSRMVTAQLRSEVAPGFGTVSIGFEAVPLSRTEREMTKKTRRKPDAALKTNIALEAVAEQATVTDLEQHYQAHPNQTYSWNKQLLDHAARAL